MIGKSLELSSMLLDQKQHLCCSGSLYCGELIANVMPLCKKNVFGVSGVYDELLTLCETIVFASGKLPDTVLTLCE